MVSFALLWRPMCLFLSCSQTTFPEESSYQIVEQLYGVPDGWTEDGVPSPATPMKFHMAVSNDRMAEFEQRVINIATPGHQLYGQFMTRDEVGDFLRPSDDTVDRIVAWMKSERVPSESIERHANWITFTVPVSQAEDMLKTRFHSFRNDVSQETAIRTLQYSVPQDIRDFIQMIQPTIKFGQFSAQENQPDLEPVATRFDDLNVNCSTTVTTKCLRRLYGIYDTEAKPDPRNKLGVSGFLDQYARYDDFRAFMRTYEPDHTDANFDVVSINGGRNDQNSSFASTEASVDIQYAVALAYNTNTTYYTTGGRGPFVPEVDQPNVGSSSNEPYLEQLHYLLNLPDEDLPAVLSTSYGEYEQIIPESYANVTCNMYAQLGARGVSVIFASGDSGVGGSCVSNDGTGRTRFMPTFPATCPFVTSVGGTYGVDPEKAVGFSGGGFSEYFQRPAYQDESVHGYLDQLGDKWEGLYNPEGRGVPDVAAQARGFVFVDHSYFMKLGGTSAAAPVFAAIVSRLNAARLERGQGRMGFLNPWLYSLNNTGLTDIVDGGSVGCTGYSDVGGRASTVPHASWNATQGWDPVTGLGTPDLNTLIKVACSTEGT
ncbi:Tripeptidyl-peptidase sed3 [Aspergillus cristatus]|uniref:tripeptidyl-peptidase II n=1 Tax=Aspergillus cristatus TaxID=573508 RepID=A0A1E3B862_ASPCR|nr:Tripeptidyl-peptidase sed3 [Aspergillus cristatus]